VIQDLPQDLAALYEHTLLGPIITEKDIEDLCVQAIKARIYGVCLPSSMISSAYGRLEESSIKVVCAIDFPFGASDADVKRYETEVAIDSGAHEIDVAINLGRFKEYKLLLRELRDIIEAADERPVKVVVEVSLLHPQELSDACQLALDSGARFISTSTGFSPSAENPETVKAIRSVIGPKFGLKAAGLSDFASARNLLEAGADRFGLRIAR
jgi:deoxyribose-phosphate aldolase